MKMPKVSFNKAALLAFLVRHGEKLVAAVLGLVACSLVWGGIGSIRSLRPSAKQEPQAVVADAAAAAEHIDAVKNPPAEPQALGKKLADAVGQWRETNVAPATPHAMFSRPLFGELSRRSSPDILPIEDLRAVSGVAVLAVKPSGEKAAPSRPLDLDDANTAPPARPGQRPGRRGPAQPEQPEQPAEAFAPEPVGPRGKIVPYVLVTGLIPFVKQLQEYHQRFDTASFHNASLDTPNWSGYRLERAEGPPGSGDTWTPIDIKGAARRYGAEWVGFQSEPALLQVVLPATQENRDPAVSPIPFSTPMPQLTDGSWGFNALHPWFVDFFQRDAAEKSSKALADQERADTGANIFGLNDSSLDGGSGPPRLGVPVMTNDPELGAESGMAGQVIQGPEYRLFRFIDLDVKPGQTYRYRVKSVCWNPNLNVPSRHLVDPTIAAQATLESPESAPTSPVVVTDGARLLVQPLPKQAMKRLKPGLVAVQILGEKPNAGSLALRALLMEPGGLANVDPLQNKRGEPRSQGDAITTNRVLLDVRGRLEDRTETRTTKPTSPPEPVEMIFLRPDGTCDVVSAAESQLDIERYRATLPSDQANAAAGDRAGQPPADGDSTFDTPKK